MGHTLPHTDQLRDELHHAGEHAKRMIDHIIGALSLALEDHQAAELAAVEASGRSAETKPTSSSNNEKELTAQEPADIMTALQPAATNQEQAVSVYKRDKRGKRVPDNQPGTWCYDFTEEGVRHRKSLPKVKTKKEAKAIERHAQHKVQTGAADQELIQTLKGQLAEVRAEMKNINSNKAGDKEIRFEDFIDSEYLPEKKTYNPETYAHYEHMAQIFSAHFKGRLIHEITAGDVRAFRQERANSKTRTGTDRAVGTLNREIRQLSGVFQLAVENGYIKNNLARVVKNIPVDNVREKVLEPEEEEKLFAALTGDRAKFKPIAQLALHTGLRLSEVVKLTWEQVDLLSEKPQLTIKSKGRGRKKKKRFIPLIGAAFKLLQDLRAECDGKGRVFTGRGISPTNVCHRFSVICDEIGLPDVTMHTLRHTFGTRFVDNGGNPAHAQQVLGHSSLATTQRYLHPGEKAVRESMKKQDEVKSNERTNKH